MESSALLRSAESGDHAVTCQRSDILSVLVGQSGDLGNGEIKGREQTHLQYVLFEPTQRQWDGIVVCVLMQQGERVVVLTVEVQQARCSIGIPVGHFEI